MIQSRLILALIFLATAASSAQPALAAESQSLTVTPPLFQLSIESGHVWQSSIRVVNANPYELNVYAEVVNFEPTGESGQGRFIPVNSPSDSKATLAEWIEIARGPYKIPREQTAAIPFFVELPKDAPPGGHFAAILISTEPPASAEGALALRTSQAVSSLFFVRVEGDVIERATIREFRTLKRFYETPSAQFSLRFENKGNVHLQPKGSIVITNMWGKERGVIPVNYQSHFGNVLPESIRDFRFTWNGEPSLADIGRYRASVTLAYGKSGSQSATAETTFWVVPIRGTLVTIFALFSMIFAVGFMIRLYVRRMLALAGVPLSRPHELQSKPEEAPRPRPKLTYRSVAAPLTEGAHDLRARLANVRESLDVVRTIGEFILNYRLFFGSIAVLVISFVLLVVYISAVSTEQRPYEVTIQHQGATQTLDAEEVIRVRQESAPLATSDEQHYRIVITNASGELGIGARATALLEERGYAIDTIDTASSSHVDSVIIAPESLSAEIDQLARVLQNGFTTTFAIELQTIEEEEIPTVTIRIGEQKK